MGLCGWDCVNGYCCNVRAYANSHAVRCVMVSAVRHTHLVHCPKDSVAMLCKNSQGTFMLVEASAAARDSLFGALHCPGMPKGAASGGVMTLQCCFK